MSSAPTGTAKLRPLPLWVAATLTAVGICPSNALFRIDVWQGKLDAIEGDLVESWRMSEDLMTLTMQLREGVVFFDKSSMPTESTVPDEFNGGKILGDEFVCEDAKATVERNVWPKEWETRITRTPAAFNHLESVACPDGPRGYTLVMSFNAPLAKTMAAMSSGGYFPMLDKDFHRVDRCLWRSGGSRLPRHGGS